MKGVVKAADRAVFALGATSLVSIVFTLTDGDPWALVRMPAAAVAIAVVLGLPACAAGVLGARIPAIAVGGAFLVAATVILLEQALGETWIGGTGSTFSLWLGLGIGLVAAGSAPPDDDEDDEEEDGHGA